jgi:hypothetical protein
MKHRGSRRLLVLAGISLVGATGCVPTSPEQAAADYVGFVADFVRQFLAAWLF